MPVETHKRKDVIHNFSKSLCWLNPNGLHSFDNKIRHVLISYVKVKSKTRVQNSVLLRRGEKRTKKPPRNSCKNIILCTKCKKNK